MSRPLRLHPFHRWGHPSGDHRESAKILCRPRACRHLVFGARRVSAVNLRRISLGRPLTPSSALLASPPIRSALRSWGQRPESWTRKHRRAPPSYRHLLARTVRCYQLEVPRSAWPSREATRLRRPQLRRPIRSRPGVASGCAAWRDGGAPPVAQTRQLRRNQSSTPAAHEWLLWSRLRGARVQSRLACPVGSVRGLVAL